MLKKEFIVLIKRNYIKLGFYGLIGLRFKVNSYLVNNLLTEFLYL